MQKVCILGSTGSVGVNTLRVIAEHPQRFSVHSLSCHSNIDLMAQQCRQFTPEIAVVVDVAAAAELEKHLNETGCGTRVVAGHAALEQVVIESGVDQVMAAIVGAAGLPSVLAAAKAGKRILLANKEALVMSGELLMQTVHDAGAELLPIDSEHNAIFQCLPSGTPDTGVEQLLLTGSGGPFRTVPLSALSSVTPDQACAHPNWDMGRKISVDSATMMNKGLELIEARWLFRIAPEKIRIVVHPQSIVHSMVSYVDGSVIAHMAAPDMRVPIAHAMAYPERIVSGVDCPDFYDLARLEFEAPDEKRFPSLSLARQTLDGDTAAPVVLNAANEVAVDAFLRHRIPFTAISSVIAESLDKSGHGVATELEHILAVDRETRLLSESIVGKLSRCA